MMYKYSGLDDRVQLRCNRLSIMNGTLQRSGCRLDRQWKPPCFHRMHRGGKKEESRNKDVGEGHGYSSI